MDLGGGRYLCVAVGALASNGCLVPDGKRDGGRSQREVATEEGAIEADFELGFLILSGMLV
jgi:hypothetical protein